MSDDIWENLDPFISLESLLEVKIQKVTPTKVFYFYKDPKDPSKVKVASVYHQNVWKYADKMVDPPPEVKTGGDIDPHSYNKPEDVKTAAGGAAPIVPDLPKKPPKPKKAKPSWGPAPSSYTPPPKSTFAPTPEPPKAMLAKPNIPSPLDLSVVGSGSFLGGAGQKTIYKDSSGKEWLFKVAKGKDGITDKPYAAAAQEAFSTIARQVNPEHPAVGGISLGGMLGTLQPMIGTGSPTNLAGSAPADLSDTEKADVAVEHLLDWMMSQHDSHGANLVRTKDGRIVGVDKEQAFKYFGADKLSTDYHPNAVYGENEPFYNKFWRDWSDKKFDFDPTKMKDAVSAIGGIGIGGFLGAIAPYAASLWPDKVEEQEKFLKQATERKIHLRRDFEKFLTDLYKKRMDEDGKFTFDDGWQSGKGPKVKIKTYTASEYASMQSVQEHDFKDPTTKAIDTSKIALKLVKSKPVEDLQKFLSDLGLTPLNLISGPYSHVAILDRETYKKATADKEVQVDIEVAASTAAPKYFPDKSYPLPIKPNAKDISKIESEVLGSIGKRINTDGGMVEGQVSKAKKVVGADGKSYYLFHFKLRDKAWVPFAAKGESAVWKFSHAAYSSEKDVSVEESGYSDSVDTRRWKGDSGEIHLAAGAHKYAYMGGMYVKVTPKDEQSVEDALRETLNLVKTDLDKDLLRDPSPEEREVLKLSRILWAADPKTADDLPESERTTDNLKSLLASRGYDASRLDKIQEVEIAPGFSTHIEPGRYKRLGNGKFRYLFNGISSMESALSVITSGLLGIHERNLLGIKKFGGSYDSDVESGSADGILTRVVTDAGEDYSFSSHSFHGAYQAIISPEEADRLDPYMHPSDRYGRCRKESYEWKQRVTVDQLISNQAKSYSQGAEMSFRKGIDKARILRIVTQSEGSRHALIHHAKERGVREVNGVPIDDFVVVANKLGDVYQRYVKPMGY